MADGAATLLLENLSHLLTSCADLISGAEDELHLLMNEIETLRDFLQDAANKPKEEESFSKMKSQIEEVVYEAQDSIDSYLTRAAAAQAKFDLFRRRRHAEPASSLAEEVRSLREDKLKPMLEKARIDLDTMLLIADESDPILEEPPHQINVEKVSSISQKNVVGFEDERNTIIGYLMEPTQELHFISVLGVGGQGKTTVAKIVYESREIQYEFPDRIWVTVSWDPNTKDVFLNILKQITSKDMSRMTDAMLAETVHNLLRNIKFLLVLDDVWSGDAIEAISGALPKSNGMAKVLITTRSEEVGRLAGPHTHQFRLKSLPKEDAFSLLLLEVFGEIHTYPEELTKISKQIGNLCQGLPLAILIVGGILVDQLSKKQSMSELIKAWTEVFTSMRNFLDCHGYDFCHLWVVELSYNTLPNDLKILLLYLGVFPEDYEIPATTVTHLWIAEGFIQRKEGQCLEDIAEEKLNRLILRKLVIADKVRPNGKVKTCRLHDIVREFCKSKQCEVNLFREIRRNRKETTYDPPISDLQRHRRLCIRSGPLDFFSSEVPYVPGVRSLLCFSKTESVLGPADTSKIPGDAFELLRVLAIKPVTFTRFPLELSQLFCLRYVVLSSNFKFLPEAVSRLRNIQTIRIRTTSRTLEIKADIWKLIRLRHLKTNASIILHKEPENDCGHEELQTLTHLSPENCTMNVLERARCLRKLGIRGTLSMLLDGEVGSRNIDNLKKLNHLETLILLNDIHIISPSEGKLRCLPPPDKFPPKLRSLTLSATFLDWEHMSVLGMLPKLEVLKLKDNAFVGESWEVMDGSFASLQVLQIGYTDLVLWRASSGQHFLPSLKFLALRNCEKLEALPQGLATVKSLQEIELQRPTKRVTDSAKKFAEESRIKLSIYFPADE